MKTAERISLLGTCPVFAGISPAELALLAEMMETERVRPGEILCAAGESADRIYVVAAGRLNVNLPGSQTPLRRLGPGDLLGEYGMFSHQGRTATVLADTETILLSLDYARFRAFLLQYPSATLMLLQTAIERLVHAERDV